MFDFTHAVHKSASIIFSRDVEFDEQAPVAPVLEEEARSDITMDQDDIGLTPTPAEVPPDLEPVNPNTVDESPIPDLGYSLYG